MKQHKQARTLELRATIARVLDARSLAQASGGMSQPQPWSRVPWLDPDPQPW